jgi:hypothetical protein
VPARTSQRAQRRSYIHVKCPLLLSDFNLNRKLPTKLDRRSVYEVHKVAGSIPDGVIGIFHWHKSFWSHYGPGVDSASNRNEYQVYFLGVNVAGALGWQPYHHPVPFSRNLGTLTSWNPLGPSRPVTGLLYLFYSGYHIVDSASALLPAVHLVTLYGAGFCCALPINWWLIHTCRLHIIVQYVRSSFPSVGYLNWFTYEFLYYIHCYISLHHFHYCNDICIFSLNM